MLRTTKIWLSTLLPALLGGWIGLQGYAQTILMPDLVISEVRISNVRDNTFTVS